MGGARAVEGGRAGNGVRPVDGAATDTNRRPEPTDEEAVAVAAAVQLSLRAGGDGLDHGEASRWRFSGRWWSKPVPQRRNRPG